MNMNYFSLLLILSLTIFGCDTKKMVETPDKHFVGTWELRGHGMMDGILIKINRDNEKKLTGRVVELNDNKYVKMFLDSNSIVISSIERRSNFQFMFQENKIGSELFGLYGLDTKLTYQAQFLNHDTIVLSEDQSVTNINQSSIRLVRRESK